MKIKHIFQNVTSLVMLLRDIVAIKACCFFYKEKKSKNQWCHYVTL